MNPVKLTRVPAVTPENVGDHSRRAFQNPYVLVLAVCVIQVLLTAVARGVKIPRRAIAQCIARDKELLDEVTALLEHLDTIVHAVANVDQTVIGDTHTVHWVSKLRRWRVSGRDVGPQIRVVRHTPVGAPVPLVLAGGRIYDQHALVLIAVGNVGLVRDRVDFDVGRLT